MAHSDSSLDSKYLRQQHLQLLRSQLLAQRRLTTKELAASTGLSIVTVGTLLQRMATTGELLDPVLVPSDGGRPAYRYSYNAEYIHGLILNGYHVGRERNVISAKIINLKGEVVHSQIFNVPQVELATFDKIVDELLQRFPRIKSLGFVLPGAEYGGVVTYGDYESLNGVAFSGHMEERYHIPVCIDNDVNAAVRGYCAKHNLKDTSVAYMFFPDKFPPGLGLFLHGDVYTGATGFIGEVSFLPFDINWVEPPPGSFLWYLKRLAITICCMQNPDLIVLNGKLVDETYPELLREYLATLIPTYCIPKIIVSTDFYDDMDVGSKTGVLQLLNRSEAFEKE